MILHPFLRGRERKKTERERERVFRKIVFSSSKQRKRSTAVYQLTFWKVMEMADWLTWVRREGLETSVVHTRIGKQWHMQEGVLTKNLRKYLPGVEGLHGNR